MKYVVLELAVTGDDQWRRLATLSEPEPTGSISDDAPGRRDVYVFGWWQGAPGVWRCRSGLDLANKMVRQIITEDLDLIADLVAGPHELTITRGGYPMTLRFRLSAGGDL